MTASTRSCVLLSISPPLHPRLPLSHHGFISFSTRESNGQQRSDLIRGSRNGCGYTTKGMRVLTVPGTAALTTVAPFSPSHTHTQRLSSTCFSASSCSAADRYMRPFYIHVRVSLFVALRMYHCVWLRVACTSVCASVCLPLPHLWNDFNLPPSPPLTSPKKVCTVNHPCCLPASLIPFSSLVRHCRKGSRAGKRISLGEGVGGTHIYIYILAQNSTCGRQ